eukprot:1680005-Rhodomonas_salina.1
MSENKPIALDLAVGGVIVFDFVAMQVVHYAFACIACLGAVELVHLFAVLAWDIVGAMRCHAYLLDVDPDEPFMVEMTLAESGEQSK